MQFKIAFILSVMFAASPVVFGQVTGRTVEYRDGDTVLEGYIAYDDAVTGPRPAVMVVPEWQGLNDYAKGRADQLAALGYAGFAIDMYGKGVRPDTHQAAAKISGIYFKDRALMRQRAKAAYDYLLQQAQVDSSKVAAIGYCFGGAAVLEMARAGWPLAGVAAFHGFLDTPMPAHPGDIKAPIRIFQGDEDSFTFPGLEGFRKEMHEAQALDWQVIILSGAVHRFTDPQAGNDKGKGMAYNKTADEESWNALKLFLNEVFNGRKEGQVIGAIGVSGSSVENDHAAALAVTQPAAG